MIKHYCDWCGKRIHEHYNLTRKGDIFCLNGKPENELTNYMIKGQRYAIKIPSLWVETNNGEETGYVSLHEPKEYELCAECVVKIWELRHDSTRT